MGRRTSKELEEVQGLRQEVQDLRRTVARLRKELRKAGPPDAEDDDEQEQSARKSGGRTGVRCKCGAEEFRFFTTPSSTIRICASCGDRQKT